MDTVILAGGRGTRLKPFTITLPKPLVPLGERPILEIVIQRLKACGVQKIILAVNHMAELIKAFFGDGSKLGVQISYSEETVPLGTVGPLKMIPSLPENFIVMNGDVLTDLDFKDLFKKHVESGCEMTLATVKREQRTEFGVIDFDPSTHRLTGFREKPVFPLNVCIGIYVFRKSILEKIPPHTAFGLDDLVQVMLQETRPVHIYPFGGKWLDIGSPEDYQRAYEESHHFD